MKKSERLFQLVNLLRGRRTAITAEQLADVLEVNVRTIYRDIQSLQASGIDINGEAGVGYLISRQCDIAPLMFDFNELQAVLLGCDIVRVWTDETLAGASQRALDKIRATLSDELLQHAENTAYRVPNFVPDVLRARHKTLRQACEQHIKLRMHYTDGEDNISQRTIWPLSLLFWGKSWTLLSWCELRDDYRSFRIDRMHDPIEQVGHYTPSQDRSLDDYLKRICYA